MTRYWKDEDEEKYRERGIDPDLIYCLEFNPQDGFDIDDIDRVLAVYEGENDERDWRWVLRLKNGCFVYLQGGCGYTGWDCQSWATHIVCSTALEAANQPDLVSWHDPEEQRFVNLSLIDQIQTGKTATWRETIDSEFPDVPKIDH